MFQTLKAKGSLTFEIGFNERNLKQVAEFLSEKFELYHYKDGMTTSKKEFLKLLKENLCDSGESLY